MNYNYVGPEHLLYGLARIREEDETLNRVMGGLGLDSRKITMNLDDFLGVQTTQPVARITTIDTAVYWPIKKSKMELTEVLDRYGIKTDVNPTRSSGHETVEEVYGLPTKPEESSKVVGEINRDLNSDIPAKVLVNYDKDDPAEIRQAVGVRDVFDLIGQPYTESPPRDEVVNDLRSSVEGVTSLANMVEGKK
jgi:hypothetical protein